MSLVYFFHWFWCACTILDKTFVDFFTFYHNVFSPQVKCNYYQQKLKEKINCQFTKSSNHPKAKFWRFSIKSCKILAAKLWKHSCPDLRWANIKSDVTANPITNHCAGWHAAAPPAPKKIQRQASATTPTAAPRERKGQGTTIARECPWPTPRWKDAPRRRHTEMPIPPYVAWAPSQEPLCTCQPEKT